MFSLIKSHSKIYNVNQRTGNNNEIKELHFIKMGKGIKI